MNYVASEPDFSIATGKGILRSYRTSLSFWNRWYIASKEDRMGELLDKQLQYYKQHKEEIVAKYEGKYVVIHDEEIAGTFNSERDAYVYCVSHFKIGTFFMQEVLADATE